MKTKIKTLFLTALLLLLPAAVQAQYNYVTNNAVIVPGVTDVGLHANDGTTNITLPFAFSFYGKRYTRAAVSDNGIIQFNINAITYGDNLSLPSNPEISPHDVMPYNTIFVFWDDLRTDTTNSGIFTSISGTAPNRIFNIEWRATYNYGSYSNVNFEARLYEGQERVDMIYGEINGNGDSATVGIESANASSYNQYECNSGVLFSNLQLTFLPSLTKLSIISPANNSLFTNDTIIVSGTNASSAGLALDTVLCSINFGTPQTVTTTNGFTNWTATVPLDWRPGIAPGGLSRFAVWSVDCAGNVSSWVGATYIYLPSLSLVFVTNGSGSASITVGNSTIAGFPTVSAYGDGSFPLTSGPLLLQKPCNLTAIPGSGYIFSNWMVSVNGGSTNVFATSPKHTFHTFYINSYGDLSPNSPLTLIANFVTNRFLSVTGTYNGLFTSDTGDNGFFTIKVADKDGKLATFSGSVLIDGIKTTFNKGSFDLNGLGTAVNPGLTVNLQLPFDGSGMISGSLVNSNGTSEMLGYLASGVTNFDGKYTMVVPGNPTNSANEPGGAGYGLLNIKKGVINLAGGKLADGAAFKQTVAIGKNGEWPLYSAYTAGTIMGLLTVSNGGITGTLDWNSDGAGTAYTNGGFETAPVVTGGLYDSNAVAFAAQPTLTCGDGLLTTTVTNTANKFTFGKTVKKLTLTVASGKLTVGITNNGVAAAGEGVVVGTNAATGYLLHSGVSSSFDLQ